MKAIVRREYGAPETLQLVEMAVPTVGPDDVLIKVYASSVNPYDWHLVRGEPYLARAGGLRKPKDPNMGIDVAGTVCALGANVHGFEVGDEVFGGGRGTLAEFALSSEGRLVKKPSGLTFESAAAIPCAGVTALQGLRDKGEVQGGQSVLINGAAGGVGTFGVQIAKSMGAIVTGVCSTRNLDFVRSIGADDVVDYTCEDFALRQKKFDVILDTVGNRSLSDLRRALTARGTLVEVGGAGGKWLGPASLMLKAAATSRLVRHQLRPMIAKITSEDLLALLALIETGKLVPIVDRTYSLDQGPTAIAYLEEGHARGKVVVVV